MKKKILVIVLATFLLVTAFAQSVELKKSTKNSAETIGESDWPMFRYDLGNTAYTTSDGPETNETLFIKNMMAPIYTSPIVVENKIYVGSGSGLFCLDYENGDQIWNFTDQTISWSSPSFNNGKVVFGTNAGFVFCLNASDGSEIWNFTTGGITDQIYSSPAVTEDYVYIGATNGEFYCLNMTDGKITWLYDTQLPIYSTAAISNGYIYLVSYDGYIHCLDELTGEHVWKVPIGNVFINSAVVYENYLLIGNLEGIVFCLNAMTGEEQWNHTNAQVPIYSQLAVAYDRVYVCSQYSDTYDELYCLNISDGQPLWNNNIGGTIFSSPAISDFKLYIGSDSSNKIFCIDALDGSNIWNYTTATTSFSAPVISQERMYIGSTSSKLYCFKTSTQSPSIPEIYGPSAGGPLFELNFTAKSTDPMGKNVSYMWDWGDGNFSDWLGPYNSSENITTLYYWLEEEQYDVRVKAKNSDDIESEWSEPFTVNIEKQLSMENFLPGYIYFKLLNFNRSFAYIYLLETLGGSVVLGTNYLDLKLNATENVDYVKFESIHLIFGDNVTAYDYNTSDGIYTDLPMMTGLWDLTIYAYDSQGNMIDAYYQDFFLFISLGSGGQVQDNLRTNTLRHMLFHRNNR